MDFDKFRSQWADPEYRRSLALPPREPHSAIIDRMLKKEKRAGLWRSVRRGLLKGSFAVILCLAIVQLYGMESPEQPIQKVAFMLALAAMGGLNWVDKAREKCGQQRFWLTPGEFLVDERRRLTGIIPLERWTSVFISAGIISLAMYAAPFLSAGLQVACWLVTGPAVLVLQVYECRKISELKRERDDLAAQLEDQQRD